MPDHDSPKHETSSLSDRRVTNFYRKFKVTKVVSESDFETAIGMLAQMLSSAIYSDFQDHQTNR